jgi:hypothetical protein
MIRYFITIAFVFLFYTCPHAQNSRLDSLTRKFHDKSLNDTTKVLVLLGIADELISPGGLTLIIELNLDSAIQRKQTSTEASDGVINILAVHSITNASEIRR